MFFYGLKIFFLIWFSIFIYGCMWRITKDRRVKQAQKKLDEIPIETRSSKIVDEEMINFISCLWPILLPSLIGFYICSFFARKISNLIAWFRNLIEKRNLKNHQ